MQKSTSRAAQITTKLNPENSEKINLKKTQASERRRRTIEKVKEVHCQPTIDKKDANESVKDALWYVLQKECNNGELTKYMSKSKRVMTKIVPKLAKTSTAQPNRLAASLSLLYTGTMISKNKYVSVRKSDKLNGTPDYHIPYQELVRQINIQHDTELGCTRIPEIAGCRRDLEKLLVYLFKFYQKLEEANPGTFYQYWNIGELIIVLVLLGADGAPFGKSITATSLNVSLLNVLLRLNSRNHNFLVAAGNCEEDHPQFLNVTQAVYSEMEAIEGKQYVIEGQTVVFKLALVPGDQKWISKVSGELNNAATYPSPYANVAQKDLGNLNGTYGKTWVKWDYGKRIEVAKMVAALKTKSKSRQQITSQIAKHKSRQEFEPLIGKYVDLVKVEPLHMNFAWVHWQDAIFTLTQQRALDVYLNALAKHKISKLN